MATTNYTQQPRPMPAPNQYIEGAVCPACEREWLRPEPAHNCYSRFCDKYICTPCGTQEALTGFFWATRALERGARLNEAGQDVVQRSHQP